MNKAISHFLSVKWVFLLILFLLAPLVVNAKTKVNRKVQEVNFSDMSIKGTIRNPDGAYLVQKKGIKFMPLYEIQKDMDAKIRSSTDFIR